MANIVAERASFDQDHLILQRHERLGRALRDTTLKALVLNPGPAMRYLTGLNFHLMERPTVVVFKPGMPPAIVLPEFEAGRLQDLPFEIEPFTYTEDPKTWPQAFGRMAQSRRLAGTRIGVEPMALRVLELRYLEKAAPDAAFVSGEAPLGLLRSRKDAAEIAAMRTAVDVAQRAVQQTLPAILPGITEQALAAELTVQLLRAGSGPTLPFAPIVSFGSNSANPHAEPTGRELCDGDLVLVDWGASVGGYFSDLTRVFSSGPAPAEMVRVAEIVERANEAGRKAARPGIRAGDVDVATRRVIEEAGFGKYFIHRTGHGLGLEGHEPPYIRGDNDEILEPGMTFTVEPGIYIPDVGGVRIEDDVVITEDGAETLSSIPRNLVSL